MDIENLLTKNIELLENEIYLNILLRNDGKNLLDLGVHNSVSDPKY